MPSLTLFLFSVFTYASGGFEISKYLSKVDLATLSKIVYRLLPLMTIIGIPLENQVTICFLLLLVA